MNKSEKKSLSQESLNEQGVDVLEDEIAFGVDDEVDLIEYLDAILSNKYRIGLVALFAAILVFANSLRVDNLYMATTTVAINIKENPGGVAPKNYRAADALGLIEHDFVIEAAHSNQKFRLLARMKSMRFSEIFITENNLLPYIYHKQWDADKKEWKEGFKPDMREAGGIFAGSMRGIEPDEESGLLRVNFKTRDAQLSADLANKFVKRFNQFIRDQELEELTQRRGYLNKRLTEVSNIEIHKSIYRLMEAQIAAESLLFARPEYPLELIQPAFPALHKMYPKRKQWATLTFIGLIMLGIMGAIGSVIIKKIRAEMSSFKDKSAEKKPPPSSSTDDKNELKSEEPKDMGSDRLSIDEFVDDNDLGDVWIDKK